MAKAQKKGKDRRIDRTAWQIAVGVIAICLVVGIYQMMLNLDSTAEQQASLSHITCFQDFETKDFQGNTVDESVFSDYKLTVINCWETTCGPCVSEMPDLYLLAQEYKDKGVQIIGICGDSIDADSEVNESRYKDALKIIDSTGAAYRHLVPSKEIAKQFLTHVVAFPTTIFVDATGKEVFYNMGANNADDWRKIIDEKLDEINS